MNRDPDRLGLRRRVERHYDATSFLYRIFWGEHIHHGFWPAPGGSPLDAQVRLVSYLADRAEVARGDRVLDVGCGYGAASRWLAARYDCRATGITISRRQARIASRRHRRAAGWLAVVRSDAAALPFADRSFDVVWVVECLEHLDDKQAFIRRARRLLAPGGRLALCSWQAGGDQIDRRLIDSVCDAFLCPSLATATEYRSWCEAEGLVIRCHEDLTRNVEETWRILVRRVGRLRPLRWLVGVELRRFVKGFPSIARAYETGAMSYGLLVAQRPA